MSPPQEQTTSGHHPQKFCKIFVLCSCGGARVFAEQGIILSPGLSVVVFHAMPVGTSWRVPHRFRALWIYWLASYEALILGLGLGFVFGVNLSVLVLTLPVE